MFSAFVLVFSLHFLTQLIHSPFFSIVHQGKIIIDHGGLFKKKEDDMPELMKLYELPLDFTDKTIGRKTKGETKGDIDWAMVSKCRELWYDCTEVDRTDQQISYFIKTVPFECQILTCFKGRFF